MSVPASSLPPATFLSRARRRSQPIGNIPYDNPAQLGPVRPLRLRNAGYLQRLILTHRLAGQYGVAAPTAVDPFGNIGGGLGFVTVRLGAIGEVLNVTGEALAIISALDNQYRYGMGSIGQGPGNIALPAIQSVPTAAGAGIAPWSGFWGYDVPVEIDFANAMWPLGMVQLAVNSLEANIEIKHRPVNATVGVPGSGIYLPAGTSTGPNATGGTNVQEIFFDTIEEASAAPPLSFIHRWDERNMPLNIGSGDNRLRLPQSDFYTRILFCLVTGGVNALAPDAASLARFQLAYGPNLSPYDYSADVLNYVMARQYSFTMPAGWYALDLLEDTHTERDTIDASATTDLSMIISLLGANVSGGAYLKVVTEQMIPLEIPTYQPAM